MTFIEAQKIVGTTGYIKVERDQLKIIVHVIDARIVFGRTEVKIEPFDYDGDTSGTAWISIDRFITN